MKRYSFRLATVLRVRRIEELVARQRVGAANRRSRELATRAQIAAARYAELPTVIGPLDADHFHALREEGARLGMALARSAEGLEAARTAQLDAMRELIEAKRKVAVLERLDSAGRDEWLLEEARDDRLTLDDFANARERGVAELDAP